MPKLRAKLLLCHHCAVSLSKDERDHYGYQCHPCLVREHELLVLMERDPDHPDVEWLQGSPVDIGLLPPSRT